MSLPSDCASRPAVTSLRSSRRLRPRCPGRAGGIARGTRADDPARTRVRRTLEDTPFYARSVLSQRLLGEDVTAVHESLSLDRFRTRWVQALLPFRMPRRAR